MREARILGVEGSYYHVVSRVVDRRLVFRKEEKEVIRRMLRRVSDFSGVKLLTYALMGNHFHILLQVPKRVEIDDDELLRRIKVLYGDGEHQNVEKIINEYKAMGPDAEAALKEFREKYLYRMYDLAEFMKTLKQRMTMWYNGTRARTGTLWEDRYKSILVEGKTYALAMIAAYIDLNAVRAGLVVDPKDYRFCGYGEAMGGGGGGMLAKEGIKLVMESLGADAEWREVSGEYRKFVFAVGEEKGQTKEGKPTQPGIAREKVKEVLKAGGKLGLGDLLRCRVRYFTDGVALGSKAYVNGIFAQHRKHFSKQRKDGARKLRWGEWGELCGLRDLRMDVIAAPKPR
jgi:putative transposase